MKDATWTDIPPNPVDDRLKDYLLARIAASAGGKWKTCLYRACGKYKRCKGGPRGTFSRDGEPLCAGHECHSDILWPDVRPEPGEES